MDDHALAVVIEPIQGEGGDASGYAGIHSKEGTRPV